MPALSKIRMIFWFLALFGRELSSFPSILTNSFLKRSFSRSLSTSGVENMGLAEYITANDVFVVGEGADFVTYQYKNVRVDEISPLASMYCADIAYGGSPYLREVSMYHNGFMRATFDCVSLAI